MVFKYAVSAIPSEFIGIWEVIDGPLRGATLEFRRDGVAIATLRNRGKTEIDESRVRFDGNKILLTSNDSQTGKVETVTQEVVAVSADELVFRDEARKVYRMKRIPK